MTLKKRKTEDLEIIINDQEIHGKRVIEGRLINLVI